MSEIIYTAQRGLSLLGDEVGAWMADTTAETLAGSELATDGDMAVLTGWTLLAGTGGGSIVSVSGEMKFTQGGSSKWMHAYQGISVTAGKTYQFYVSNKTISSGTNVQVAVGVSAPSTDTGYTGSYETKSISVAANLEQITFTATATGTVYIVITDGQSAAATSTWDDAAARLAVPDLSTADNGLGVHGSITKTAVVTGADLVGYGGFGGLGGELVTNGAFATDTSNWTDASDSGGNISWHPSGHLDLVYSSGIARAHQAITTEIGKVYILTMTKISASSLVQVGSSGAGSSDILQTSDDANNVSVEFVAASTTTDITIVKPTSGAATVDDVSIKKTESYIEQPYNANLDYTGDFYYSDWIETDSNITTTQYIIRRNDEASGSAGRFVLQVAAGVLGFYIGPTLIVSYDVSASTAYHVCVTRSGSNIYLFVNGVLVDSGTSSTSLAVTDGILWFGVGNSGAGGTTLTSPFLGKMCIPSTGPVNRTAAQIKSIYDKEKHLFKQYSTYTREGEDYTINVPLTVINPSVVDTVAKNKSLDGVNEEAIIDRSEPKWDLQTVPLQRHTTDSPRIAHIEELMHATRASEVFEIDLYDLGETIDVSRDSSGYSQNRVDTEDFLSIGFTVRER